MTITILNFLHHINRINTTKNSVTSQFAPMCIQRKFFFATIFIILCFVMNHFITGHSHPNIRFPFVLPDTKIIFSNINIVIFLMFVFPVFPAIFQITHIYFPSYYYLIFTKRFGFIRCIDKLCRLTVIRFHPVKLCITQLFCGIDFMPSVCIAVHKVSDRIFKMVIQIELSFYINLPETSNAFHLKLNLSVQTCASNSLSS
nr:MAG TPA: hypothetical protein [Caudoviricetes sp.]